MPNDGGRMTSQGHGHQIVYQKNGITVRATPPTRFGVLYYLGNDPSTAWATIEQAVENAPKGKKNG